MSTDRKLYIIGSIDEDSYLKFSLELEELERKKLAPVEVELSSGGGNAYDALAFFDRIRTSSCSIHITGFGLIASAAVLILSAGDKRRMGKNAWVMVHEDSFKRSGEVHELEREVKHFREMEDQWCEILASVSNLSADHWSGLHRNTTRLTAQKCLEYGLIEGVV